VAFFGILIPVVGILAQGLRVRDQSQPPSVRQQARLLRLALMPALAVSVLWLGSHLVALAVPGAGRAAAMIEQAFPAVFAVVPVVLFVAILRLRLWDIDVVVTRAFGYALLAGFIGLVYGIVLGATGWILRVEGWSAIVAMAVVAMVIEPVRVRLQALANRLVFGQSLSPRDAMRALVTRLENVAATDELAELTSVVVAGTRCSAAQLWLVAGDELRLVAAAPPDGVGRRQPLAGTGMTVTGADMCVPVTHEGGPVAVLALRLPAGVSLPRRELRLVGDLAGHAGLLVANARLTDTLARQVDLVMARADDLRRSRVQVVAAQDDERRRLERDIHDGAQQELVAVLIQLRALQRRSAGAQPPGEVLAALRTSLADTATTLRQLCTGDPPAALVEAGLAGALDAAVTPARRSGLDVRVVCSIGFRLPPDVESALYFCALEAVQNASKHARAHRVLIGLDRDGDDVVLSVADDGVGFDPAGAPAGSGLANLVARLTVLGGTVEIRSVPGAGTRLACRVPLTREPAGVDA
jgi:signal transduction histidine kinase